MSIATKFEYLGETKEKIREGINKLGGGLSTSNTFRSYADKLDEIYDSLPKVEESDVESATLEGTIKGGLDINLKGNTSQYSTTGKQLFNTKLLTNRTFAGGINIVVDDEGKWHFNGTSTQGGTLKLEMTNEESQRFANKVIYYNTLNAVGSTNTFQLVVRNSDKTAKTQKSIGDTSSGSWDLTNENFSNGEYFEFFIYISGSGTTINKEFAVMISDTENVPYEEYTGGIASPSPSYPQPINVVSGDNTIEVEGKNLFDKNNVINGYYINTSNTLVSDVNSFYTDYYDIHNYTNITFSGLDDTEANRKIVFYDINKTRIDYFTAKNRTINVPTANSLDRTKTPYYMRISASKDYLNTLQLEIGNSSTTYEPYQSQTYPINLGDKEICKIGNYEDKIFKAIKGDEIYDSLSVEEKNTLNYGKWYLRKNIFKHTFTGNENWVEIGTRYSLDLTGYSSGVIPILCNSFVNALSWAAHTTTDNTIILYKDSAWQTARLSINYSGAGSLSNFKNYLSNNNVEAYYPLATPTNELFNDAQQEQLEDIYNNMLSYEGQTNVSQVNNDKAFKIDIKAILDWRNSNSN